MENVLPPSPVGESEHVASEHSPGVRSAETVTTAEATHSVAYRVVWLTMVLAVLLGAWVGQGLLLADPPNILAGWALIIAASVAFVTLSGWLAKRAIQPSAASARPGGWLDRLPAQYLLFGIALASGALAFWCAATPELQPVPALTTWLAGIGFFLAGARELDRRREFAIEERWPRWEIGALIGIALVALALRAFSLEQIPQNFGGDEGEMGLQAREVLAGEATNPFTTGWLSHPFLWFYMQALSLAIFGDSIFGLRILSVLVGTAAIPALYLFARPLFGRTAAFGAVFLLAAYHVHVHFSRLGVNNIADPLFALLAFSAFITGWRRNSALAFALAGVVCGVAQHFYMGSRLTPLLIGVLVLQQLIVDPRRVWSLLSRFWLIGVGFALGVGPLAAHFINDPSALTARLGMVGIIQSGWLEQQMAEGATLLSILTKQAYNSFGAYTFVADRSAWYDPRIPLLDQGSAVLLALGVALALARSRRMEWFLLPAWLVGTAVLGGVMLVNSPESPRYVTTAPAICMLIALALERLVEVLGRTFDRRRGMAIGVALLAALVAWNLNFYFREYTPRRTYAWFNTEITTTMGWFIRSQPAPAYVYFFGPPRLYYGNGTIRFVAPDIAGVDILDPIADPDMLPALPEGYRPVFLFLPEREAELALVQQLYPGGQVMRFSGISEPAPLFSAYVLP